MIHANAARKQTLSEQGDDDLDCLSLSETLVDLDCLSLSESLVDLDCVSLSKTHVDQTEASSLPNKIPTKVSCTCCGKNFGRIQELKRHLLTNLPYWILCPWLECSSTYDRPYVLQMHMKNKHQISDFRFEQGFERNKVQIYDPGKLFGPMVNGTLSVEEAADVALSMAKEGLGEGHGRHAGVILWGKRTRFCNGKLISIDTYLPQSATSSVLDS